MSKPRPSLSQLAQTAEALTRINAPAVCHRAHAIPRRSEAELMSSHLPHIRDFIVVMSAYPQQVRWMLQGVELAPVSQIHAAARQIAEEGAE